MIPFLQRLWRRPLTIIGILLVALHLVVATAAPWLTPHDPLRLLDAPLEQPTATYWLGTDELGRDFFSRLLLGGQISIIAAACTGLIAAFGGGIIGLATAYHRGWFDDVVSRIVEMNLSIPSILLVSLFVTGFGQSLAVLIGVMSLIYMMGVIRTARAQGILIMEQGYVKAAKLRGEGALAIILREMLPNVAELLTVEFALRTSSALLLVSALSFLGLGVSPPTPDWGLMIQSGLQSIRSEPWLILAPSLCISTLVIGINFATEGIADLLGLEASRGATGQ
ncbi:DppC ABC-type dipeptide/oligopeptide/nickel transport systems, permease components [Rhabdaerophilaceae bacterium]